MVEVCDFGFFSERGKIYMVSMLTKRLISFVALDGLQTDLASIRRLRPEHQNYGKQEDYEFKHTVLKL